MKTLEDFVVLALGEICQIVLKYPAELKVFG